MEAAERDLGPHAAGGRRFGEPGADEKLLAVAERIPVCELVEVPADHYVHREKPEEFLAVVLSWLARHPR